MYQLLTIFSSNVFEVIIGLMPRFPPKLSKHKSLRVCPFPCNLCTVFETFCGEESSNHSNTNKQAVCYFEEGVAVFYFKNTLKMTVLKQN